MESFCGIFEEKRCGDLTQALWGGRIERHGAGACSPPLLIGTIINTLGQQLGLEYLTQVGGYATAMAGPAMAVSIGCALHCPPLVLSAWITVGSAANTGRGRRLWRAGGHSGAAELGKLVSKETKVDILVTPL